MRACMRLTDALVKRLAPPAKSSAIVYDDKVPGLGVRLTANERARSGPARR